MNKIYTMLLAAALLAVSPNVWADDPPSIDGNVFGGGRMAPVSNTVTQATGVDHSTTATVDIYASTITGGVFGGNDITGAVIQGTAASSKVTIHDKCDDATSVGEVYGGGNGYYKYKIGDADPIAIGDITENNKSIAVESGTTITVLDNENNTVATFTTAVATTYGGLLPTLGNTSVLIGGDEGGNQNIKLSEVYGGAKNAYVTGTASVTVNSGTISQVFAGNNVGGTVNASSLTINGTSVPTPSPESFSDIVWDNVGVLTGTDGYGVGEAYGGGNKAAGTASTVTINCGSYVKDLYGGANAAAITGDIALNVTGGMIYRVFGGNNASGSISGSIMVNVDKNNDCTTFGLGYVYGGGNLAAYSAPTSGDYTGNYPMVNIKNGTVVYDVFGGGLGSTAIITGNPQVHVGTATCGTSGHTIANHEVLVKGSVYGGGNAAPVTGDPYVETNGKANNGVIIRNYVFGAGLGASAKVTGNTLVKILGNTKVDKNVYGGGHGGDVTGNTHVIIGESDPDDSGNNGN